MRTLKPRAWTVSDRPVLTNRQEAQRLAQAFPSLAAKAEPLFGAEALQQLLDMLKAGQSDAALKELERALREYVS